MVMQASEIELGTDVTTNQLVILDGAARNLSTYIIGKQGMGKSKLLEQIAYQDMLNGDGLLFLDPHADSVELLVSMVPDGREKDIIWWDPTDHQRPFGLNPFWCPNSQKVDSKGDNFMAALGSVAEFSTIFDSGAPRMKSMLKNLATAFLVNQGYTLAETPRFLGDEQYRSQFYSALDSAGYPQVREYWERFDRRRERDQEEVASSALNKLEPFQNDRIMSGIFGQSTNSIDFRQVMDEGKIILVRLPPEELGPTNAAFIGAFIVWGVFEAALSRVNVPQGERRQFHLIADEFQTFMSTAFPRLIAEGRKFKIDTTVAHQNRAQLANIQMRQTILTVGNKIVFAVTGQDAAELAKEFRIVVPLAETRKETIYAIAPNVLEHIGRHGHENTGVVDCYRKLRAHMNTFFDRGAEYVRHESDRPVNQPEVRDALRRLEGSLIYLDRDFDPSRTTSTAISEGRRALEQMIDNCLYEIMRSTNSFSFLTPPLEITTLPDADVLEKEYHSRIVNPPDQDYVDHLNEMRHIGNVGQLLEILEQVTLTVLFPIYYSHEVHMYKKIFDIYEKSTNHPSRWGLRDSIIKQYEHEHEREHFQSRTDAYLFVNAMWVYRWEMEMCDRIVDLGHLLYAAPCRVATGEYKEEPIPSRLHSDVEAEIANELATLPFYTAKCSLAGTAPAPLDRLGAQDHQNPEVMKHYKSLQQKLTKFYDLAKGEFERSNLENSTQEINPTQLLMNARERLTTIVSIELGRFIRFRASAGDEWDRLLNDVWSALDALYGIVFNFTRGDYSPAGYIPDMVREVRKANRDYIYKMAPFYTEYWRLMNEEGGDVGRAYYDEHFPEQEKRCSEFHIRNLYPPPRTSELNEDTNTSAINRRWKIALDLHDWELYTATTIRSLGYLLRQDSSGVSTGQVESILDNQLKEYKEHKLKTLPPLAAATNSQSGTDKLRERSRSMYGRARDEVEREMRNRARDTIKEYDTDDTANDEDDEDLREEK